MTSTLSCTSPSPCSQIIWWTHHNLPMNLFQSQRSLSRKTTCQTNLMRNTSKRMFNHRLQCQLTCFSPAATGNQQEKTRDMPWGQMRISVILVNILKTTIFKTVTWTRECKSKRTKLLLNFQSPHHRKPKNPSMLTWLLVPFLLQTRPRKQVELKDTSLNPRSPKKYRLASSPNLAITTSYLIRSRRKAQIRAPF